MREVFSTDPLAEFALRAEATFSLGELACDNRSIFYRACVKFVTRFASKINCEVCSQMARVSRELKNCDNSDLLRKTLARLTQCSKPVKNRKKTRFLIYSSRFMNGFERLSAYATFRTTAHTAKMKPLLAKWWDFKIFFWSNNKAFTLLNSKGQAICLQKLQAVVINKDHTKVKRLFEKQTVTPCELVHFIQSQSELCQ